MLSKTIPNIKPKIVLPGVLFGYGIKLVSLSPRKEKRLNMSGNKR